MRNGDVAKRRSRPPAIVIMLLCQAFAAFAIAAGAVTPPGLPEAPAGYEWRPLTELSDEFDEASLDRSKWQPFHPYWQGRGPSRFDAANVVVRNGMLELRSTATSEDRASVKDAETEVWVRAACLASLRPIASYGYYEARVKASKLSMTSSFWLQGKYSEIDVAEQLGRPAKNPDKQRWHQMNTHYFTPGWTVDKATPKVWAMPGGSAEEFHVYGAWWRDAKTVWFFHDGVKVAEVETAADFLEPMYLFFDTEVFSWEGLPTVASFMEPDGDTMRVDWVRAWRLVRSDADGEPARVLH